MAEFIDHSKEVLEALERAEEAALEAMGNVGVSFAKNNLTQASRVDTGRLRNSITHLVLAGSYKSARALNRMRICSGRKADL